jgi:hypothetical protein
LIPALRRTLRGTINSLLDVNPGAFGARRIVLLPRPPRRVLAEHFEQLVGGRDRLGAAGENVLACPALTVQRLVLVDIVAQRGAVELDPSE